MSCDKNLAREEWDFCTNPEAKKKGFAGCPDSELIPCRFYEYARHDPTLVAHAKLFTTLEAVNCWISTNLPSTLPWLDLGTSTRGSNSANIPQIEELESAYEPSPHDRWVRRFFHYFPEFPSVPWLGIERIERQKRMQLVWDRPDPIEIVGVDELTDERGEFVDQVFSDEGNARSVVIPIQIWPGYFSGDYEKALAAILDQLCFQTKLPPGTSGMQPKKLRSALKELAAYRFKLAGFTGAQSTSYTKENFPPTARHYTTPTAWLRAARSAEEALKPGQCLKWFRLVVKLTGFPIVSEDQLEEDI